MNKENQTPRRLSKGNRFRRYLDMKDALVNRKFNSIPIERVQYSPTVSHCWESKLATQGSGYSQINLNGSGYGSQQGYYLIHILSKRHVNQMPTEEQLVEQDLECSHLCHNKVCCNPSHLQWESGQTSKCLSAHC